MKVQVQLRVLDALNVRLAVCECVYSDDSAALFAPQSLRQSIRVSIPSSYWSPMVQKLIESCMFYRRE